MSSRTGGFALAQSRLTRPVGVVAVERRQIDAGDRLQQPRRLRILLDRPPARQARHPPLGSRKVNANILDPVEIERHARITSGMGQGENVGAGHVLC